MSVTNYSIEEWLKTEPESYAEASEEVQELIRAKMSELQELCREHDVPIVMYAVTSNTLDEQAITSKAYFGKTVSRIPELFPMLDLTKDLLSDVSLLRGVPALLAAIVKRNNTAREKAEASVH